MRRKTSSVAPECISRKQVRKMENPSSPMLAPATFFIYRFVGPKDKPKKLTDKNGRGDRRKKGKTSLIKGIKKKSGDGTYDAYLTLNRETWSLDMQFPEFKGKKTQRLVRDSQL